MTRILVVDDDEVLRDFLKECLEGDGFEVAVAANGVDGLDRAESLSPDILITDIFMPDMEGLEFIRTIRGGHPDVRIIAISGVHSEGQLDYLDAAGQLGADLVLRKPFKLDALRAAVGEQLVE